MQADDIRHARRQVKAAAEETVGLIEPTEDEKRNGWTAEALSAYVRDREASAQLRIDPNGPGRKVRPTAANSKYSPFKWRG